MSTKRTGRNLATRSVSTRAVVEQEIRILQQGFKKINATRANRVKFLKKAGILDSKGNLVKDLR